MRNVRVLTALGAAALMALTGCTSDNEAAPVSSERPAHAFDEIRHIVIEQHDTEAHEIVTAIAHVCSLTDLDCPDGTEELIVLGSHQFLPHDVHLYDPDTVLKPPDECLANGTYCLLSMAHCEFASAADMTLAEHCVPEGSRVVEAAADLDLTEHHQCITATAEASRHVDLDCVRAGGEQGDGPVPTEEDDPS